MHIHPTCPTKVKGLANNQVPWCNAHYIQVGVQKAELATLQVVQLISTKFATRGSTNQEAWAPSPPGFPHTMLNVKKVKDNMQLAFIEKFFTNHTIKTSVQTRYLRFKGMSYESESYLCDTSCVQLRKVLARFQCGNTQLEVMLGAWKGVPYVERLCRGCGLGKVKNEKHLPLVCPNTQKVWELFVQPYPSPTLALLLSSCRLQTRSP